MAGGTVTGVLYLSNGDIAVAAGANAIVSLASDTSETIPSTMLPPGGGYPQFTIADVPAGIWKAFLRPDPATAYTLATYGGPNSTSASTTFQVSDDTTVYSINIVTAPAGFLEIKVVDSNKEPIAGAHILVQNLDGSLAILPDVTGSTGAAFLGNIPLQYKLCVIGPPGYETVWYPQVKKFAKAQVLKLKVQGDNQSVTVHLAATSAS